MLTALGVIFAILIVVGLIKFIGEFFLDSIGFLILGILGFCTLIGVIIMICCFA